MPPTAPKKAAAKKTNPSAGRPVLYPDVVSAVCRGESALTVQQAKDLIGWLEEADDQKFGPDFVVVDREGKKIRLLNNVANRPLYMSNVENLVQEHLMGRWRLNGEPLIIGKTGLTLNCQHRLVSLILAEQDRVGDNAAHWKALGRKAPLTMECVVVYGVEEDDATVNTMDTCKPRSLADVFYRSPYFAKLKPSDRTKAARVLDSAVKLLWFRTGADADAFAPRRTHAEALDFVGRHEKVLKCVAHVMEEDGEKRRISASEHGCLSTGYAAAMMYLMACSASDEAEYRDKNGIASEKKLDFSRIDKAGEFWTLFAGQAPEFWPLRQALAGLHTAPTGKELDEGVVHTPSLDERIGVVAKAWNLFAAGEPLKVELLRLDYVKDEDQYLRLIENATVLGIDRGKPDLEDEDEAEADADGGDEPAAEPEPAPAPEKAAKQPKPKPVPPKPGNANPNGGTTNGVDDEIKAEYDRVKAEHPDLLLLFRNPASQGVTVYGDDAKNAAQVLGKKYATTKSGLHRMAFGIGALDENAAKLEAAGHQVGVAVRENGAWTVTDWEAPEPAEDAAE